MKRRCEGHWFHLWRSSGFIRSHRVLSEFYTCARCGAEKRVQVKP